MSSMYPGRDIDFFVVVDGQPKGPFKGLRQVFELNITPDTPIWYRGLEYWIPAAVDEVTRQLFDPMSGFYAANPDALQLMQARQQGTTTFNRPEASRLPDAPVSEAEPVRKPVSGGAVSPNPGAACLTLQTRRPRSYLVGSLIIMFLMSFPVGLIALIFSLKTRRKLRDNDLEGAFRASETSQLWIAIGIVGGLIWIVAWSIISASF